MRCSDHKLEGMVDVQNRRCEAEACSKHPSFNLPSETRGVRCSDHKLEGMVDVKSRRCEAEGCSKHPTFNLPRETRGVRCADHKLEGMVDVRHRRCEAEGCSRRPTFNLPSETRGVRCADHKLAGMVYILNKRCSVLGCQGEALYGEEPGKRAYRCALHKTFSMVNLFLAGKCDVLDCEKAYEVLVGGTKYCLLHSPDPQHSITVKRLCRYCDIKEASRYVCRDCKQISCKKEWAVVRHLRRSVTTRFEYNSSRMLNGCSKKRPDVFFDLPGHCVIVEIDEHQHAAYAESCECARLSEIVSSIGGRPVIVIRFNPDTTRKAGRPLPLCLKDKVNLLVDTVKKELTARYDRFLVKLVQLYFDDASDDSLYLPLREEDITLLVAV